MPNNKLVLPIIIGVAVVVILGGVGIWFYQSSQAPKENPVVTLPKTLAPSPANQPETTQPSINANQLTNNDPAKVAQPTNTTSTTTSQSKYKDGQYSASGKYTSPGGAQALDLTATIKDGKIASLNLISKATDAKSERYQSLFKDGVSGVIVGKSLDDNLDPGTVNGSSLTHVGFVEAINLIKQEASK